jgi:hypothetical protein
MEIIGSQGDKIGSLTNAVSSDRSITINRIHDVTIVSTRETLAKSLRKRSSAIRHMANCFSISL